jgi:hypothetical protein
MDNSNITCLSGINLFWRETYGNRRISYSYYDGDHFGKLLWSMYNNNIPDKYQWYLIQVTKMTILYMQRENLILR